MGDVQGIWTSRLDMGPSLRGELVIGREASGWRATIGAVEARSNSLDFMFPDNAGRFTSDGDSSWWMQPPGLAGVAYATPVRLLRAADGRMRGAVRPLAQTFTLHLALSEDANGAWSAAFRNPEFNLNGGASRFAAQRDGNRILVQTREGETVRTLDVIEGGPMRVTWPPVPKPLELSRSREVPPGYLARAPQRYAYAAPARLHDGWRTRRANAEGFDEARLAALVQGVIDSDPAAQRPNLFHSILVARRGRLVLEEYFHGYDRDTPHDLRSAGKTFASVLVGAVMREGAPIRPETRIYATLGLPARKEDLGRSDITLAHLMTHSSGLACDDNDESSPGNEGAMQGQQDQPDWWRFALDLPMATAPGARYAYCTAGMNLVGAALHAATDETAFQLFDRTIAKPLGFGLYHWNLAPNGQAYLGGGVYVRPRDLAKIGQLYLDGGVWNGRRILDRSWVERSTRAQIEINETTTGMDAARFAAIATRGADGFAWHRYGVRVGERRVESYEASGNGGQFLIVVPEFDLVVVLTGGNYGQGGIWTRWRDDIVGAQIIAALRSDAASRAAP
jgi:CubicO group peptidase (beta-lactamase class C family)